MEQSGSKLIWDKVYEHTTACTLTPHCLTKLTVLEKSIYEESKAKQKLSGLKQELQCRLRTCQNPTQNCRISPLIIVILTDTRTNTLGTHAAQDEFLFPRNSLFGIHYQSINILFLLYLYANKYMQTEGAEVPKIGGV